MGKTHFLDNIFQKIKEENLTILRSIIQFVSTIKFNKKTLQMECLLFIGRFSFLASISSAYSKEFPTKNKLRLIKNFDSMLPKETSRVEACVGLPFFVK
ncbi:CLUMA_CG003567, isoform A [Clunio marinus]|uniref:CLUMA_CG003567, isoform A n=1 Tax=Clunio marinus TaxID=568069 RepID=A0A1J1HTB0_9DIPT|nr:CLUMA_CG003567, isoform A [Clunio marinus]